MTSSKLATSAIRTTLLRTKKSSSFSSNLKTEMAASRETEFPLTLRDMGPQQGAAQKQQHSASESSRDGSKPLRKSKILAMLDGEMPDWLAGPLVPNILNLISPETSSHTFTKIQKGSAPQTNKPAIPSERGVVSASSTFVKGKTNAKTTTVTTDNASGQAATSRSEASPLLYSYKQYQPVPAVVYTQHEEEANELVETMKGPMGFDLEWLVTFRRGKAPMERRIALVQLCDARMILLVQVSAMKRFPQKVKEVLENKDIIKLGVNIRNDGQKLFRDFGLLPAALVELGTLAHQADPSFSTAHKRNVVALAKVVERYTGKTLDKGKVRTSNWEAPKLSQAQITYAANDAHCALVVYKRLMEIAKEEKREVDWKECAADLGREYRAKCAAPTIVAAVPASLTCSWQADCEAEGKFSDDEGSAYQVEVEAVEPALSNPSVSQFSRASSMSSVSLPGTSSSSRVSASTTQSTVARPGEPPRPQHLRAYNLWHNRNMTLHDICAALRSRDNPLAESTVISYVVKALQADPTLPYSMNRLKAFVQLEAGSWMRHRDWILEQDGYKK